jgi:glucose/arabinose dehydrogenase
VHPVGQQRIVDLAHAHTGALLHALDRGLGEASPLSIASLMRRLQPSS